MSALTNEDGVINLNELKKKKPTELAKYAAEMGIEGSGGMRKQDLIFALLQAPYRELGSGVFRGRARNSARRLRLPSCARL